MIAMPSSFEGKGGNDETSDSTDTHTNWLAKTLRTCGVAVRNSRWSVSRHWQINQGSEAAQGEWWDRTRSPSPLSLS